MDLSKLIHGFFALCQTKPSWSLTKISKLVEASALNERCWMSQSTHCLGSVVPMAMFFFWQCFFSGNLGLFCSFFNCSVIYFAGWLVWRHGGGRRRASRTAWGTTSLGLYHHQRPPPPSANHFLRKDAQKDINCAVVSFVHLEYHIGFQVIKCILWQFGVVWFGGWLIVFPWQPTLEES